MPGTLLASVGLILSSFYESTHCTEEENKVERS